jgi:hypothetical protein
MFYVYYILLYNNSILYLMNYIQIQKNPEKITKSLCDLYMYAMNYDLKIMELMERME